MYDILYIMCVYGKMIKIFLGYTIVSYQFFHCVFFNSLSYQNKGSAYVIPNSDFQFFYLPQI